MWNGRDPILKERLFGLTNGEGNHSEDVKELYYYLDATPTHSYLAFLYKYPQGQFPYGHLVEENRRRGKGDLEFELIDTGLRGRPLLRRRGRVRQGLARGHSDAGHGPQSRARAGDLDVLPQLWFRNMWSWKPDARRPGLFAASDGIGVQSRVFGNYRLYCEGSPELLFCDNDTNVRRLYGVAGAHGFFKDGINDHVVAGAADAVNPDRSGTKAAPATGWPCRRGARSRCACA